MDDMLLKLLMDRFDQQDKMLDEIRENFKEHHEKDEHYWRKLDVQEGQVNLLKVIVGGVITVLVGSWSWIISKIGF